MRPRVPRPRKVSTKFDPVRLHEDIDTYTDAIYAILTFVNHARWDQDTRKLRDIPFGVGRRLRTSAKNKLQPNVQVTPDAVVQLSASLGIVAEAKPGVSRSVDVWRTNLEQLAKYDDDLTGWWTKDEKIKSHDIAVLLPLPRVVKFLDIVQSELKEGSVKFARPVAVISFTKNTGANSTFFILRLEHSELGTITDSVLREKLRSATPVNMKTLLQVDTDKKFIDAEPLLPYTLYVLWDMVLSRRASGRQPELGQSWTAVDVEVTELTREVQDFYGFRSDGAHSIEVPRVSWIRKALDGLVAFEMASNESDGNYRVRYRRYRTKDQDTISFFGRLADKYQERLRLAAAKQEKKPLLELASAAEAPDAPPVANP